MRSLVSTHRELTVVLAMGAFVRLAVEVAYWPALFYSDSWAYLKAAYNGFPAAVEPVRPSGYADIPREARFLCQPADHPDRDNGAAHYLWHEESPARRELGGPGAPGSDELLAEFARTVIMDQPGDYLRVVAADVGRFFVPGHGSIGGSDDALRLPRRPGESVRDDPAVRERLLPGYTPPARFPAALLNGYAKVVHLPRPLLALAAILALAAATLGIARPGRLAHHKEIFLLAGTGLALVIGSAATSEFVLRYLVPAAPFLLAAGAIAAAELVALRSSRGRAPAGSPSGQRPRSGPR